MNKKAIVITCLLAAMIIGLFATTIVGTESMHPEAGENDVVTASLDMEEPLQVDQVGDDVFTVSQGENVWTVEAIQADDYDEHNRSSAVDEVNTVEDFYSYDDPWSDSACTPNDPPLQKEGVSTIWFFHGEEGVSIGLINDNVSTEDDGEVHMTFEGLPLDWEWAVKDDPGSGTDSFYVNDTSIYVEWFWYSENTDGGAIRTSDSFENVSVSMDHTNNMDEWKLTAIGQESIKEGEKHWIGTLQLPLLIGALAMFILLIIVLSKDEKERW